MIFALDSCDREVIAWCASSAGFSADARSIIRQMHYYHHCSAIAARCYYSSGERFRRPLARRFDDLRALVEFAHAGSIAGAADRLFRTPSAITRQVQRLEAALGGKLLDRSVKPPRLNSLGSRVLEHARDLLQRTEALKTYVERGRTSRPLTDRPRALRINAAHASQLTS